MNADKLAEALRDVLPYAERDGCPNVFLDAATEALAEHDAQPAQAAQPDKPPFVLERWGFPVGSSPYRLERMPDGYWTPWHVAQQTLMETRARMLYEFDKAREQAAQPVGEMPSDAVQMQPEPPATELQTLLNSAVATLRHARIFITSREKMHPTGVRLYDDLIDQLNACTEAQPVGVPDGFLQHIASVCRGTIENCEPKPSLIPEDTREYHGGQCLNELGNIADEIDAMLTAPQPPTRPSADAEDAGVREFIRDIATQAPEKPDYWSTCGQCERNIQRAQELLDAARAAEGDDK